MVSSGGAVTLPEDGETNMDWKEQLIRITMMKGSRFAQHGNVKHTWDDPSVMLW